MKILSRISLTLTAFSVILSVASGIAIPASGIERGEAAPTDTQAVDVDARKVLCENPLGESQRLTTKLRTAVVDPDAYELIDELKFTYTQYGLYRLLILYQ
ncbi:hypothetical protein V5O48_010324 [Marasmius crinis-equi]|uniref:Uncharacterized protein n=1 Tax=Marasmius crinis-equi TaxID=585013 RepID=A0ABR3F8N6_9AGAR